MELLVILLHSALAAVTALLASLIWESVAELEEERIPASFDRRRTLVWAAVTSGLDLGLGLVVLPRLIVLLVAAAV